MIMIVNIFFTYNSHFVHSTLDVVVVDVDDASVGDSGDANDDDG